MINEQNAQFAAGKIGQAPTGGPQELVYTITTKGRLADPKEFEHIIVRSNPDGSAVRLKDVARVELASKDYDFIGRVNGKQATLHGDLPAARRKCAGRCRRSRNKTMNELVAALSAGPRLQRALRHHALRQGVDPRGGEDAGRSDGAGVPGGVPVPAELARDADSVCRGAGVADRHVRRLACCWATRSTRSTLFGMVLSIGIVVDDAIVVLENVERIMHEEHKDAREAAIQAMEEVTGPVIAIVLTLCAVFVPIAFLGGLTGELYRQFAVTMSIAVVISGIVALTLTPIAVRADPQARAPASRARLPLVQRLVPRASPAAMPTASAWICAAAASAWFCSSAWWRSPVSCGASRRAAWCRTKIRATTSARCSCPMGRACSAPTRW